MSSITFDTHEFIKRLRDSGFTETQAEALSTAPSLSQALDGQLATKTDITDLRRDMVDEARPFEMGSRYRTGANRVAGRYSGQVATISR